MFLEETYVTLACGFHVFNVETNSRVCQVGTFSSLPLWPEMLEMAVIKKWQGEIPVNGQDRYICKIRQEEVVVVGSK